MKIVMLGHYPQGKLSGGVAVHILNLVSSMGKIDGVDFDFISFGKNDSIFRCNNSKICIIKSKWVYYLCPLFALFRLSSEIKKIDPDIIHVQGSNMSVYLLYGVFFSLKKCAKVITVHGIVNLESHFKKNLFSRIFGSLEKWFERYALAKIDSIICVSPQSKAIIERFAPSNIYVISNGVSVDKISKVIPSMVIEKPSILYLGELRPEKGVDLLLRAIPKIIENYPDILLYIAGSGILESQLKYLTKELDIEKNVVFLGHVSEEKYSYYKAVDLYVLPSRWDNQPITILEAMACGKAIVASNVGGIPDMVDHGVTGLLFEPDNIDDLANKITYLLQSESVIGNMGQAGRLKVKDYSWDEIAKKTLCCYSKIISANQ